MITNFKLFENKKNFVLNDSGEPKTFYHGSQIPDINIFKSFKDNTGTEGIYFTDNLDHASDYGHIIYKANLIMNNPLILNAQDSYYNDYYDIMSKNIRYAKNSDKYDSMIIKNLKDPRDGKPVEDVEYDSNDVYVVFSNSQIKIIK